MINERIRMIRTKLDLSQREFGRLLGVTGSYISQVESNRIQPSIDFICVLIRVFRVNRAWLEDGSGSMMLEEDRPSLGERLRTARIKRGYTQVELAKTAECNRNSISTAERSQTTPSADLVEKICKALWINESWLRFGMGSMERSELVAKVLDIIRANREVRAAVEQRIKSQDC